MATKQQDFPAIEKNGDGSITFKYRLDEEGAMEIIGDGPKLAVKVKITAGPVSHDIPNKEKPCF